MFAIEIIFCYFRFLTFGQGERFSTKKINESTGLYIENAGKISFYQDEWKIILNVNLTKHKAEFAYNKNVVELIMNKCEELKLIEIGDVTNEGCGSTAHQLRTLTDIINDNNWFTKDIRFRRNIFSDLLLNDCLKDKHSFEKEFEKMSALGNKTITVHARQISFISSHNHTPTTDYMENQLSYIGSTLSAAKNSSFNTTQLLQLRISIQELISYEIAVLTSFALKSIWMLYHL